VYIYQLIRYTRACWAYDQFLLRVNLLTKSWCHKGFTCLAYRQLFANFRIVTTILFTDKTFLWTKCCLICFVTIVKPFLTLIFTTVHTGDLIWKKGSRRMWSIDRGCLLLHGTWSHQRSVYDLSLICISYWTFEIEYCSVFFISINKISSNHTSIQYIPVNSKYKIITLRFIPVCTWMCNWI
jgi:hypothetical protein